MFIAMNSQKTDPQNCFDLFAASAIALRAIRLRCLPICLRQIQQACFFDILRSCFVGIAVHAVGTYVSTPRRAFRLAALHLHQTIEKTNPSLMPAFLLAQIRQACFFDILRSCFVGIAVHAIGTHAFYF